jgi:DNA-binding MarR family transcriptional regulator
MPKKARKVALATLGAQLDRALMLRKELQSLEAEIAEETGLTAPRALVMRALATSPDVSQTVATDLTSIDRSTMAQIVENLLKIGLATRVRDKKDKRKYRVRLSAKGLKVYHDGA